MAGKRKRTAAPVALGQMIPDLLSPRLREVGDAMSRIWDIWPDAAGDAVAAYTRPEAFKEETLFVRVAHSSGMQELCFHRQGIIERLNSTLEGARVREIRFKIGPLA